MFTSNPLPHISASGGDLDPTVLIQYGPMGAIAAIFATTAWILYKRLQSNWDRERQELLTQIANTTTRADRLQEELSRLNTMVQTQVMTALNEANRTVTETIALVRRHD